MKPAWDSEEAWSWEQALQEGTLDDEEVAALEAMVERGEAPSIEVAARQMDNEPARSLNERGRRHF